MIREHQSVARLVAAARAFTLDLQISKVSAACCIRDMLVVFFVIVFFLSFLRVHKLRSTTFDKRTCVSAAAAQ